MHIPDPRLEIAITHNTHLTHLTHSLAPGCPHARKAGHASSRSSDSEDKTTENGIITEAAAAHDTTTATTDTDTDRQTAKVPKHIHKQEKYVCRSDRRRAGAGTCQSERTDAGTLRVASGAQEPGSQSGKTVRTAPRVVHPQARESCVEGETERGKGRVNA